MLSYSDQRIESFSRTSRDFSEVISSYEKCNKYRISQPQASLLCVLTLLSSQISICLDSIVLYILGEQKHEQLSPPDPKDLSSEC